MKFGALLTCLLIPAAVAGGAMLSQDFSRDPAAAGWRTFGEASLFGWDSTNGALEVTWDSARSNSYFWLPLGTVLSRADDFSLGFDLRLHDIAIGTSSNKPSTFEIGIGFFRTTNAMATNFFRGAGTTSLGPLNLVEFDYFPAYLAYGATFAPTIAMTNHAIAFSDNHPLTLTVGDLFHVTMTYTASNRTLRTFVLRNGVPYSGSTSDALRNLTLGANQDFLVDAVGVLSYSDAQQVANSEAFWGSLVAHGTVDNIVAITPDPPIATIALSRASPTQVQFLSRTNWVYALERSTNVVTWSKVSIEVAGTGSTLVLQDPAPTPSSAFYRIRASKP